MQHRHTRDFLLLTSLMSTKHTMSWCSVFAVNVVGSLPSGAPTTGADKIFREASVCMRQHFIAGFACIASPHTTRWGCRSQHIGCQAVDSQNQTE